MYTTFAIGAAMGGFSPVVEIMFADFATYAAEGIMNIAAKQRFNSGGKLSCPVTYIMPNGGGQSGCTHSQSCESWMSNVPGLKLVAPTFPADVKAFMQASIRDDDPVVFYFQRTLMGLSEEVPDVQDIPTLKNAAKVVKEGKDITVVSYHRALINVLEAVKDFEAETGKTVEVIDPRVLLPLDTDKIFASVKKTGRVLVATEAPERGSMGQQISAIISENCFSDLKKPVKRISGKNGISPFGVSGELYLYPKKHEYIAALKALVE
jgi:pyruvate dehydrogenase E1 component beta subunit